MPIYEYECTSCHHHFDLIQKINEEPATTCPECAKNSLVKLVSAAGFQLKGTGWYETDFKNKGTTKPTNTDTTTKTATPASDKPSSDTSSATNKPTTPSVSESA